MAADKDVAVDWVVGAAVAVAVAVGDELRVAACGCDVIY